MQAIVVAACVEERERNSRCLGTQAQLQLSASPSSTPRVTAPAVAYSTVERLCCWKHLPESMLRARRDAAGAQATAIAGWMKRRSPGFYSTSRSARRRASSGQQLGVADTSAIWRWSSMATTSCIISCLRKRRISPARLQQQQQRHLVLHLAIASFFAPVVYLCFITQLLAIDKLMRHNQPTTSKCHATMSTRLAQVN